MSEPHPDFDVALSFAGEDRGIVVMLAKYLGDRGVKCFYDEDQATALWGADLQAYFTNVYSKWSKYVVVFISEAYRRKRWSRLELRAALSRAMQEDRAYVLPVRLDDTELEGLLPTVGYLQIDKASPEASIAIICARLCEKLGLPLSPPKGHDVATPLASELEGQVTFDYANHNGRYRIGDGLYLFETMWSRASNEKIYCLNDAPSIWGVATVAVGRPISEILNEDGLDFTSRHRDVSAGQTVILKNTSGFFAAIKVLAISAAGHGSNEDRLTFRFSIRRDGSANFSGLDWDNESVAQAKREEHTAAIIDGIIIHAYEKWLTSSASFEFLQPDEFAASFPNETLDTVISTVRQLRAHGLLEGYPADDDHATAFSLSRRGLDRAMRSSPNNGYERNLRLIAENVAASGTAGMARNWDIAHATSINQQIVNHLLYELRDRGLVTLTPPTAAGGARFYAMPTALLPAFIDREFPES